MGRVVLLTSNELRHRFVRVALGLDDGLDVVRTYCERPTVSLAAELDRRDVVSDEERAHLAGRTRSEADFFGALCALAPDRSHPEVVERGAINTDDVIQQITALAPDLLVTFGCSIVASPLVSAFAGRAVNLHLGLSPYYRGSGTNFWPLVDGEPGLVGATFLHLDEGVDTGDIIHQIRARVYPGDDAHTIGHRLIADAVVTLVQLLRRFDDLEPMPQPATIGGKVCRRADFDAAAIRRLAENFAGGMVSDYLADRDARDAATPIVQHPLLAADGPRLP